MPTYSNDNGLKPGTAAPDFELPGADGKTYSLASFKDAKVLVVAFWCNHCPYVQAVEERTIALQNELRARGVEFVLISANDAVKYPEDSFDEMKKRVVARKYPFPYLYDESQDVVRAYDAVCTPDYFVFDEKRKLVANTRLDDNWKEPAKVTRRELKEICEAALAGKPLPFAASPSMGCSIKWRG